MTTVHYEHLGIQERKTTWKRKPRVASQYLTDRERQVSSLLAAGIPQMLIAERLGIAQSTVWQHVHSIKTRLGLANLVQVGMWAQRNGYICGRLPPADQCDCGPNCDGRTCQPLVNA